VVILFILLGIFHNAVRLNEWRGGWGAYFLGYNTVRQYIDDTSHDAILLFRWDHMLAIMFDPESSNTQAMVKDKDLTNSSILRYYARNYSAVYITNRRPLVFNDSSIVNIANLTIVDKSPYGVFKMAVGRYYSEPFYLYLLNNQKPTNYHKVYKPAKPTK
ncbi:hypothetical protein HY485_03345, partial [Candidatus Woesearchaeota archaeon]|nr:hypothetical protein [Candidatus Woesearchaeota archaeon]